MVPLPMAIAEILDGIDLVLVSHLHADHFDEVAKKVVPKRLPLICRPGDEATIRAAGFSDVRPLEGEIGLGSLTIRQQPAQHGTGAVLSLMGEVMGFTLEAPGEPKLYWCGDSVLYPPLSAAVAAAHPDVIVTHSSGAMWDGTLIVMDAAQTLDLCEATPQATIIATHMEALDHGTVNREALRQAAEARGIAKERLHIPDDGETLVMRAPI